MATIMRADVVDVSHWDTDKDGILFNGAAAMGVKGVIAKATQGSANVDKTFVKNRAGAKAAGMLFGAYHFLDGSNPVNQADHFLATVGDLTGVLLVLDYETPSVPVHIAEDFARRLFDKTGKYVVMYSYTSMLNDIASLLSENRKQFWAKTRLWAASYNNHLVWPKGIWPKWFLWQFTGDGSGPLPHDVPKDGHNVDISVYNGDPANLAADWHN